MTLNKTNYKISKVISESEYLELTELLKQDSIQNLIRDNYILDSELTADKGTNFLIQPIPFITTYSDEWPFSMLKGASLHIIKTIKRCLELNLMVHICDYNSITCIDGKFYYKNILSISEIKDEGDWPGYNDFLKFFLFPLFVSNKTRIDVHRILKAYPNGISYGDFFKLLNGSKEFKVFRETFNLPHKEDFKETLNITSKENLIGFLNTIEDFTKSLEPYYSEQELHWIKYEVKNDYSKEEIKIKLDFVQNGIKKLNAKRIIDIGTNTGYYSKELAKSCNEIIAVDSVSSCVDNLYKFALDHDIQNITPVLCDILYPSSNRGFNLTEYKNFFDRQKSDFFILLAVMHHIIGPNPITMKEFVVFLSKLSMQGIVEWISPEENMIKHELKKYKNRHKDYNWNSFTIEISKYFNIIDILDIHGGTRKLCLLQKK